MNEDKVIEILKELMSEINSDLNKIENCPLCFSVFSRENKVIKSFITNGSRGALHTICPNCFGGLGTIRITK